MKRPDLEAMRERCDLWEEASVNEASYVAVLIIRDDFPTLLAYTERLEAWINSAPTDLLKQLGAENERLQAEVERLRAGGCARDQTTTQFCAEAVTLRAEVERLRGLLSNVMEASTAAIESCPSSYDAMGLREVRDEVLIRLGTSIADVTRAALNQREKAE
jgi:hypothetical protein